MTNGVLRVGAVADVHYGRDGDPGLRSLFERAAGLVDVLLLGGDLTDFGRPEEAELLARDLTLAVGVPVLAVLGNHDFEGGKEKEVAAAIRAAGAKVLDGDGCEVRGVGFAGVKGFGGGFGRGTLEPWGEVGVKRFVREAVDEALKLERALARLDTPTRVVLLHYAPIRETVAGEPEEIYPYLGSGRLVEPIDRYGAAAVFHGHAHHGTPEGRTPGGVPVYNVSLPILRRVNRDGLPLKVIELPVAAPVSEAAETCASRDREGAA